MSAELTRRVEDAVEELGYQRDDWASRLRSGTTASDSVGLIVLDLGDPFYASMAAGIESVATERGVLLLTASSEALPEHQDEIVQKFVSRRIDGLLVVPIGDLAVLERETRRGTPVVFLDLMPNKRIGDVVLSDHRTAAVTAVTHLISRGHRRIGFLGSNLSVHSMRERYAGYREALQRAGLRVDEQLVSTDLFDPKVAASVVGAMLDLEQPPTAIFAAYVACTIGSIQALQVRGLHNEIAVVSSDDIELGDLLSPGLTATPQDPFELGRSAAELLFQRLDGYEGPFEEVVVELQLAERGSGEIAPRRSPERGPGRQTSPPSEQPNGR